MELTTILTVLKIFATSPDLCAEVYLDAAGEPWTDSIGQTLSRYCQWTGPTPPVWNADVCCTIDDGGATCVATDANGRCVQGKTMYCKYGETVAGGVICYQPFPDACAAGHCVKAPGGTPPSQAGTSLACCNTYVCQEIGSSQQDTCENVGGTVLWCNNGMSNGDGTITCYDEP